MLTNAIVNLGAFAVSVSVGTQSEVTIACVQKDTNQCEEEESAKVSFFEKSPSCVLGNITAPKRFDFSAFFNSKVSDDYLMLLGKTSL